MEVIANTPSQVFPQNLSPRQFRLAFKTLLRITAPPSPLSETQPLLPATLLELVYHRAHHASTAPLASSTNLGSPEEPVLDIETPLSEQAILTLTLIDALPFLQIEVLEEWLPLAAELVHVVSDSGMKKACQERFWEVLSKGELDVDRVSLCVAWWSTRGGREMVLFGRGGNDRWPYMSGGLSDASKI